MENLLTSDLTIGITGGIGSGKSVVSRVLRCNGLRVFDCDYEAKKIMSEDSSVKKALVGKLGKSIYDEDGKLNRGKLAELLFCDVKIREYVNQVVHAAVRNDIKKWRKEIKGWFFIESAILATGGLIPFCDRIWLITAPLEERIKRVMKRDSASLESIEKRIDSQKNEFSQLENKNTLVLENDNITPLLPEVLKQTNKFINHQTYTIPC